MPKKKSEFELGKIGAILIPAWLIVSVFGDELFALIFFRNAHEAFGFSMSKPWWWGYQLVTTSFFILVFFTIKRIHFSNSKNDAMQQTEKNGE